MGKKGKKGLSIAFVGSVVSEELCRSSFACSMAGNTFQLGLIRALEYVINQPLYVISVKPIAMYPRGQEVLVKSGSCEIGRELRVYLLPFINLPILKQITICMSIFSRLFLWLWSTRADSRVVIVYNVFSPFSLAVLASTKLMGGKLVAIIADLPHNDYKFRGFKGILERMDFFIQTHSMRYFTGLITLTHQIGQEFAPHLPALTVEGGVEPQDAELSDDVGDPVEGGEHICLYSGALNEISGIEFLLQAFDRVSDPKYRLWIFGKGPLESLVQKAAERDPRIIYWGNLPNVRVRYYQQKATVLINPRPSGYMITKFTFPSKLLEYMVSGRPVITTVLPGIPEEYYDFVYPLYQETPEGLARAIEEVCSKDPRELEEFGRHARDFVLGKKNWLIQGERIYEFISSL